MIHSERTATMQRIISRLFTRARPSSSSHSTQPPHSMETPTAAKPPPEEIRVMDSLGREEHIPPKEFHKPPPFRQGDKKVYERSDS